VDDDAPILATEQNSQRAIVLDSVTFVRDPFAVTNPITLEPIIGPASFSLHESNPNFRIGCNRSSSRLAADDLSTSRSNSSEVCRRFLGFAQIVVQLPDGISVAGDLQVSINARGRTSNQSACRCRTIRPATPALVGCHRPRHLNSKRWNACDGGHASSYMQEAKTTWRKRIDRPLGVYFITIYDFLVVGLPPLLMFVFYLRNSDLEMSLTATIFSVGCTSW